MKALNTTLAIVMVLAALGLFYIPLDSYVMKSLGAIVLGIVIVYPAVKYWSDFLNKIR